MNHSHYNFGLLYYTTSGKLTKHFREFLLYNSGLTRFASGITELDAPLVVREQHAFFFNQNTPT